MHNSQLERELEKHKRRRGASADHGKWIDDRRDSDDRKISAKDVNLKNGSYKDGRFKEKHREELDKDQRYHDDKRRDEHSCRARTSERSDDKHYRDESRPSDSQYRKTKYQDDNGSHRVNNQDNKPKDSRVRKRSSEEIDDHHDVKPRAAKDLREDTSIKFDSRSDRARLEPPHLEKVDSNLSSSRPKGSPSSSAYAVKDQNRHGARQEESTCGDPLSEGTRRSATVSRDNGIASGGRERMSESRSSEKARFKEGNRSDVLLAEGDASPRHERISRLDVRTSPHQLTGKSPPSTSERRSDRISSQCDLNIEVSINSKSKDNGTEQEYQVEKPNLDDTHPTSDRTTQLQGNSPGYLPPPPPVRVRVDSLPILSYEDDTRSQSGDRKPNPRYNRDSSVSRGPRTPWKGPPTWPSPVSNGFMNLQHGLSQGFHPAVQQFHGPPLFGIRPSMDLNSARFHIHEAASRFQANSRPYGWHDCPPHLRNLFGDESHIYGRQEWDQNRHFLNKRGWETSADIWGAQNGNVKMEFPVPQKDHEYPQTGHRSHDERSRSEQHVADEDSSINLPTEKAPGKHAVETSESEFKKTVEPLKLLNVNGPSDNDVNFCCHYLSKIDVSVLAHLDIYEQCMLLIGSGDKSTARNISNEGHQKNNKDGLKFMGKSKQYAHRPFSLKANEAIFQRAMSLYKKQKEEMVHPGSNTVCSEEQNNLPDASADLEKTNASSANRTEKNLLLARAASTDYMEEEGTPVAITEGEHCVLPHDDEGKEFQKTTDRIEKISENQGKNADEQQCDKITDAVMFVEGPEKCEALNPECRVNLSRIHLSPESTH